MPSAASAGAGKERPVKPVKVAIKDVIDLHTFRPEEIAELVEDYIAECVRLGFSSVRIIHGKGQGFQKKRVREILGRNPHVQSFGDAPAEAGGWGATVAVLRAAKPVNT
jgi:dsDNA-specific endonuclease/ATPase MutS2